MKNFPNELYLHIAGFTIKVKFQQTEWDFARRILSQAILRLYKGFFIGLPKKVDYTISVFDTPMLDVLIKGKEKKHYIHLFHHENKNEITTFYQISIIQFQLIIREILQELLTKHGGFILHGSATRYHRKVLIFTGKNGSGKSTTMQLLHPKFPSLADDTVIIKKEKKMFYFYQTPFIEKNEWVKKNSEKFSIQGIFFLQKAKQCTITRIVDRQYVLNRLIKQLWSEEKSYKQQMKYFFEFVKEFERFYILSFPKNRKALQYLFSHNDHF